MIKMVRVSPSIVGSLLLFPGLATGQEFRFAEDTAPSTLNPVYSREMVEIRLNELLFSGLFKDSIFLEPTGDLAEKWKVSSDKREVHVTLSDRAWHDGKPVVASDVAFTVEVLRQANIASREYHRVKAIKEVEVSGPKTLIVRFQEPVIRPLRFLYFKILPKHILGKKKRLRPTDAFRLRPVGSGPYAYERFTSNELRLRRVGAASPGDIREIRALLAGPKSTQMDMLKFGYLEAIVRIPPSRVSEVRGLDSTRLYAYESLTWWYLGLNHRQPHLSNRAVREALVYALDRERIRKARLGAGTTISGPFAPRSPFYNQRVRPRKYSPEMTEQRMRSAGYTKRGGIYHDAKGRKVEFRMVMNMRWDLLYRDVALTLETELRKAGFSIKIDWLDSPTWYTKVEKQKKYDITLGIWTFDEGSNVRPLFHSAGEKNFISYNSSYMDRLLDQRRNARDPDVLLAINRNIHRVAHEELPYIFLWSIPSYSAVSTKIYDVEIHPFTFFSSIADWKYRE